MARATAQFGAPERGNDASSRPPRGRACTEPNCTTVLSTYNPSPTCYLHTAPVYRHALQRP